MEMLKRARGTAQGSPVTGGLLGAMGGMAARTPPILPQQPARAGILDRLAFAAAPEAFQQGRAFRDENRIRAAASSGDKEAAAQAALAAGRFDVYAQLQDQIEREAERPLRMRALEQDVEGGSLRNDAQRYNLQRAPVEAGQSDELHGLNVGRERFRMDRDRLGATREDALEARRQQAISELAAAGADPERRRAVALQYPDILDEPDAPEWMGQPGSTPYRVDARTGQVIQGQGKIPMSPLERAALARRSGGGGGGGGAGAGAGAYSNVPAGWEVVQ